MAENLTEEQQVEELKRWWKENGRSIIVGATLGIALIGGWQGWQGYQDSRAEQGAVLYDKFATELAAQQTAAVSADLEALTSDHAGTIYVDMAEMRMALTEVESGDLDAAMTRLQTVASSGSNNGLRQIASLRLARLYLGEEKLTQARDALANVTDTAFEAESLSIEGQLALKEGNQEAARIALEGAMERGAADSEMIGYLLQQLNTPKT